MNNKDFFETGIQPTQRLQKENSMNVTKRLIGMIGFVSCSALFGYTACGQPSVSVGVSVSLPAVEIRAESDFYEPLSPYGRWEVVGSYGRCWIPGRVEAGWRPYCSGYWQQTNAGWYWVSDEPWGWATYHYGRWNLSAQFGWYWVPHTQWAPAWVSWHRGGGYIGWAPLYPPGVRVISPQAYVFVEERRFVEPVRPSTVIVNNTTIINKTVINEAPAPAVIEKASGRKVQALPVQELRHREEAAVVATRQRTPAATTENKVQTPVPSKAAPGEQKTVAAQAPPPVEKPAPATHESAAPAPKNSKAQNANKQPAQPEKKAQPASEQPAKEKQAGHEKNQPDKADKNQGNKGNE